ncbi:hypothetical protein SCIM_0979 [Streptococcus intermedius JTH08]|nr:hypothetical protein SCIM_0979 [Streptococcus intermedius JTH08]
MICLTLLVSVSLVDCSSKGTVVQMITKPIK